MGCFCGWWQWMLVWKIPDEARRVVEYNVEDKSIKEIGPDFDTCGQAYMNGIKATNGSIYCLPFATKYFLKIIPGEGQNAEVQILREMQLPKGHWVAGALANDGCIYYFPYIGRILKLDPGYGDSLSLVGEEINEVFEVAVLGNDGYIYGISSRRVIKFNPIDHRLSCVGRSFAPNKNYCTGALLAENGNIFAVNHCGQILHIDTSKNDWKIIGNKIYYGEYLSIWGNAVLGADKCIYFPPTHHDRVLRYNPTTQNISLIGESYGNIEWDEWKWQGAVLASDGYIYCIPLAATDILQIDSRHVNEQVVAMIENLNVI